MRGAERPSPVITRCGVFTRHPPLLLTPRPPSMFYRSRPLTQSRSRTTLIPNVVTNQKICLTYRADPPPDSPKDLSKNTQVVCSSPSLSKLFLSNHKKNFGCPLPPQGLGRPPTDCPEWFQSTRDVQWKRHTQRSIHTRRIQLRYQEN